jgi:hypothetical protein
MSEEQQEVWFTLPNGNRFSLLTSWWTESGMDRFERRSQSYRFVPAADISLVAIEDIAPTKMEKRRHLGHGGFCPQRMTNILRAFASNIELPPIDVVDVERWHCPYKYIIGGGESGGVHRFYASVAAEFSHIPMVRRWMPDDVIEKEVRG